MGWSESDYRCKKHPKHTQSPGVCSSCLRERLAQLSSSSTTLTTSSCTSSTLSSYSSACGSSPPSPTAHLSAVSVTGNAVAFGRSRSMVHVVWDRSNDGVSAVEKKKKKGGFWSKLLRPISSKRRKEASLRSKTMKETPTTNWIHSHERK